MSLSGVTAHLAWGIILASGYEWVHKETAAMWPNYGVFDIFEDLQVRLRESGLDDKVEIEVWSVPDWDTAAADFVMYVKETHVEVYDAAEYLSENHAWSSTAWSSELHNALDALGLTPKDGERHRHGWIIGFSAY
jgi:hypothetical protein